MCECLEYDDGEMHLCVVCADEWREWRNSVEVPAPPPGDPRYVYLRVTRPEGYEDVHPELVVQDMRISDSWEVAIVAAPPPDNCGAMLRCDAAASAGEGKKT